MIPDVFWHRCSSVCSGTGQWQRAQHVDVTQFRVVEHISRTYVVERPANVLVRDARNVAP